MPEPGVLKKSSKRAVMQELCSCELRFLFVGLKWRVACAAQIEGMWNVTLQLHVSETLAHVQAAV